jgi:hypothetical protein
MYHKGEMNVYFLQLSKSKTMFTIFFAYGARQGSALGSFRLLSLVLLGTAYVRAGHGPPWHRGTMLACHHGIGAAHAQPWPPGLCL